MGVKYPTDLDSQLDLILVHDGGCCTWPGGHTGDGYAAIGLGRRGRSQRAHRYFYEAMRGPIPAGHHLHHTCGNRACVNPWHLEPLTPREHKQRHLRSECPRGHGPYDASTPRQRTCRKCRADDQRAYIARKRSAKEG